jgi:hypothetical protein
LTRYTPTGPPDRPSLLTPPHASPLPVAFLFLRPSTPSPRSRASARLMRGNRHPLTRLDSARQRVRSRVAGSKRAGKFHAPLMPAKPARPRTTMAEMSDQPGLRYLKTGLKVLTNARLVMSGNESAWGRASTDFASRDGDDRRRHCPPTTYGSFSMESDPCAF